MDQTSSMRLWVRAMVLGVQSWMLVGAGSRTLHAAAPAAPLRLRIATFNVSLNRERAGELVRDLRSGTNAQAGHIAGILQTVRPDVVLLNEFDHDEAGEALRLFRKRLEQPVEPGLEPLVFPHAFNPPVNTGVSPNSGPGDLHDFNRDGTATHAPPVAEASAAVRNAYANDCLGFGTFPGQYGLAVLSRFPVRTTSTRTFQKFLWRDMPGALLPDDPATPAPSDWYRPADLEVFRLSSKTHADVDIELPGGTRLHLLASHPTPPVFDGPEDRNGRRNHDEIRFWADYVDDAPWVRDDQGRTGGLAPDSRFVIVGDLNADPLDGDSRAGAVRQLLEHPRVNAAKVPSSRGGAEAARIQGGNNARQKGDPAHDTGDFNDRGNAPGNLRIDYVLPSKFGLRIVDSGVFWPEASDPGARRAEASDHRLVWVDVEVVRD